LPVDLDDVLVYVKSDAAYRLGPVRSGAASRGGAFESALTQRSRSFDGDDDHAATRDRTTRLLQTPTLGETTRERDEEDRAKRRRARVDRSSLLDRGHALVVAFASRSPVPLAGDGAAGDTYVVLRKEVPLP